MCGAVGAALFACGTDESSEDVLPGSDAGVPGETSPDAVASDGGANASDAAPDAVFEDAARVPSCSGDAGTIDDSFGTNGIFLHERDQLRRRSAARGDE